MSRIARKSCVVALLSLLVAAPAWAQSPGKISIVGGTSDAVRVYVKDKDRTDDYFRVTPGGERLLVVAEGPATLSIRFRAASTGRSSGTLRVLRDEDAFSDNGYELVRDMGASVDSSAAAEGDAASVERVLHVRVAEGEHRYAVSAVRGPSLLVRVFKTSKFDPALEAATEKNTGATVAVATAAPTPIAPVEDAVRPSPPEPQKVSDLPLTIERAPASNEPTTEPVSFDPVDLPATVEALPEKPVIPPDPNKHRGFSASYRGGVMGFLGFSGKSGAGNGGIKLSNRIWGKMPVALELAWNMTPRFGVFLEGAFVKGLRPHLVTAKSDTVPVATEYRVIPAVAGLTVFQGIGKSRFGVRFRAGVGLAYLESRARLQVPGKDLPGEVFQSAIGLAATGGAGLEYRLGPGRISVEARYLMLRTDVGPRPDSPSGEIDAVPDDLGGLQVLAGYRFQF